MKKPPEKFDRWLVASVGLHVGIVLLLFVAPSMIGARTAPWGTKAGGAGGVNIKIVSNVSGMALPSPVVTSDDAAANDSKALYKSEPAPKVKAPEKSDPEAIKLPSKNAAKKPEPVPVKPPKEIKTANAATPPPSNAVPYGQGGGNPSLRYGQNSLGNGPNGAEFGGDGTFGEKYGPYVDAMTRAIVNEWRLANPSMQRAPRVYVTFTIARSGSVSDVQLEKPTNSPSVVESAALQAVRRAKLNPLPSDYRGPDVMVRFYFDYAQ